jgi:hypothetical protein
MSDPHRAQHEPTPVYSAQQVRQGDIVLRKPWQRGVFVAGLLGAIVLAILLVLIGAHFGRVYSDQQLTNQRATQDTAHS